MKTQLLSILSVLIAAASATPARTSNQQDSSNIINNLPQDPNGLIQLGTDGVLRSLDAENQVMAYFPLDPQQIQDFNANFPQSQQASLTQTFDGVDGRDVTDRNQIYNPDQDMLPAMQRQASGTNANGAVASDVNTQNQGQNQQGQGQQGQQGQAQATGLGAATGSHMQANTCGNVGCSSHNTCYQTGCSSCLRSGNMPIGYCH
ncbi:hypothetical protein BO71DRAFT_450454 [Aspergillus ellipticus CBS 707.79]|uniref:Uncharacterized protein n=1 Tax=Aspergillus ellipticus CBS 707.79 TaxID=1448320 RepID=A0A319D8Y5_9EURO|nr:hypothetical protein BO71DRAFT_450454 [Aspergillus ellipticus CBS 707.79]